MVRRLGPADRPALERFLSAHVEESMFLLSNLREAGDDPWHRLAGPHVGSFIDGGLVGVACHLNMGNLLLSAPRDAASLAEAAVWLTARTVGGVVGPEQQVEDACAALGLASASAMFDEREGLFRLQLDQLRVPAALAEGHVHGRAPTLADLGVLVEHRVAYRVETIGERDDDALRARVQAQLPEDIARGNVWLLEREGEFVAKTAFNARITGAVQIGGVWTPPALRSRGYARCVLASHLLAARAAGVHTAILFTGDNNLAAQRAYAALGFETIGRYRVVMFT